MISQFHKHLLKFNLPAGTSRGILTTKDTWFIKLQDDKNPEIFGMGEAGPLKGLSIDDRPDFEEKLKEVCEKIKEVSLQDFNEISIPDFFKLKEFPSISFALETAVFDLLNGGNRIIFHNNFSLGLSPIPINGLIWMGQKDFMKEQIDKKLAEGYTCLKMKIGAINFKEEYDLLKEIRSRFSSQMLTIRVDANGAFSPEEAEDKLILLGKLDIHSIEQPIKPGQWSDMAYLSVRSPVWIALDEELIGVNGFEQKLALLKAIKPQFIILKPTLLGGFSACLEWISIASQLEIGWWMTSALESNIGLNAIAQFTGSLPIGSFPQGLGTGQLYSNNVPSPLVIKSGSLHYSRDYGWNTKGFFQ